jgi:hypothetical protein
MEILAHAKESNNMASKTQKTEKIRNRKSRPSKPNLKVNEKRLRTNLEVLERVSASKE